MHVKLLRPCPEFCVFAAQVWQLCFVLIHSIKSNSDKQKMTWAISSLVIGGSQNSKEVKRYRFKSSTPLQWVSEILKEQRSERAEALKGGYHVSTICDEVWTAGGCSDALHGSRFAMSQLCWAPSSAEIWIIVLRPSFSLYCLRNWAPTNQVLKHQALQVLCLAPP